MNFPLFIAKRIYFSSGAKRKVSRPAIVIATFGIAIGLAIMIISVSVALGFKKEIQSKLVGFGSHIQVMNMEQTRSYETYPICADDSLFQVLNSIDGVSNAQRYITKPCLLKTSEDFRGVVLKGISQEYNLSFLEKHLVEGDIPEFTDSISSNKIVVSQMIADALKLAVGDKIYCYFLGNSIRARKYEVSAIYCTHLMEFDNNLIFTDLYSLRKQNKWEPEQVSGIEISLDNLDMIPMVYPNVVSKVNGQIDKYGDTYYACTIDMLYSALFSWLSLLDMNVWVILALMLAVSGFTVISGLLIIILERTNMIGVLKALGGTNTSIRHIFLYFAFFIIGKGVLIGDVVGILLCYAQQSFGFIKLDAETYYVDMVPILINPVYIIVLNILTIVVSILILIVPSYLVSHIHPAKSIRFD